MFIEHSSNATIVKLGDFIKKINLFVSDHFVTINREIQLTQNQKMSHKRLWHLSFSATTELHSAKANT